MKNRPRYLEKLISWRDKPVIKVITGVRRCGKSSLLKLYRSYLRDSGVRDEAIVFMNFESMQYAEVRNYKSLYETIIAKFEIGNKYYVLLDEVQLVEEWERCINGLMVDYDVDIYITGSNSYMLSSELSTLLSGRYVEIKMLPLSFQEYLAFREVADIQNSHALEQYFGDYFVMGGLPAIALYSDHDDIANDLMSGIYNTVVMKDIIQRNQVRDPVLLDNLIRYLAANVGNTVSTKKISDYLTSAGRKTTSETIDNYLKMIESSFIVYKVNRYDMKGKLFLKTLGKYYFVDSGLRYYLAGTVNRDEGHVLENVVYLELLRRGYQVAIGKFGDLEIDFIATKGQDKKYVQVSLSIMNESTRERELRPFKKVRDNYPKILITKDRFMFDDAEGVKITNVIDFLLA